MISAKIKFNTPNDVAEFVRTVSKIEFNVDVIDNHTELDGKSIQGLYTIQLGKELTCNIYATKEEAQDTIDKLQSFIVRDFK